MPSLVSVCAERAEINVDEYGSDRHTSQLIRAGGRKRMRMRQINNMGRERERPPSKWEGKGMKWRKREGGSSIISISDMWQLAIQRRSISFDTMRDSIHSLPIM